MQTLIRLLLEQFDQGMHCLLRYLLRYVFANIEGNYGILIPDYLINCSLLITEIRKTPVGLGGAH